jgi:phosphomannomutase
LCKNGITAFGTYNVVDVNTIDGFKYELPNNCWTMIRASGTEPLLRIYAEGNTTAEVYDILANVKMSLGLEAL